EIGPLKLYGSLAWRRLIGNEDLSRQMAFADSHTFQVHGVPLARDTANVEMGMALDLGQELQAAVDYQGAFGRDAKDNYFGLKVAKRF
ncbi:autotransporter domain-containing protein, partial [Labrenzia sp. OB1]